MAVKNMDRGSFVDVTKLIAEGAAVTGTGQIGNEIDFRAVDSSFTNELGGGAARHLVVASVDAAFNTLSQFTFNVQHSDTAGSGYVTIGTVANVPLSELTVVGRNVVEFPLPPTTKRYVRLLGTVIGTDPTTGAINASIQSS